MSLDHLDPVPFRIVIEGRARVWFLPTLLDRVRSVTPAGCAFLLTVEQGAES
ncbi:hypothetical protein SK224_00265 [Microbacterium sp. BG28]|uniref:hypothetical protein n=1 Tax=Microbacterium sp. BG28 TaxID=3097356 RepID=UPI002A5ADBF1|nr:hypothetical protein [Microbacterium sp. BG28]MDY0827553.1 hypothetical protein [Microbacterium sp. BG28]